jgi:hypothetical protein
LKTFRENNQEIITKMGQQFARTETGPKGMKEKAGECASYGKHLSLLSV